MTLAAGGWKKFLLLIVLATVIGLYAAPAHAQTVRYPPPPTGQAPLPAPPTPKFGPNETSLSGPRFGLTILSPNTVEALRVDHDIVVQPIVSQFGWQFEHSFYVNDDGLSVLTEFVPLLSGLEQGVALPSLNWMVGIRSGAGTEFGLGPNI